MLRGKIKLPKWSFKPPFFSPHHPPRIPDTSTRTTESYGRKNAEILLVGFRETQLKIKIQQNSPLLTKGCPKPIINLKRQQQKSTISAQKNFTTMVHKRFAHLPKNSEYQGKRDTKLKSYTHSIDGTETAEQRLVLFVTIFHPLPNKL